MLRWDLMLVAAFVPAAPELVLKGERHTGTHWAASTLERNFGHAACPNVLAMCTESCDGTGELSEGTYCCWKHGYANASCPYNGLSPAPSHVQLVRSPYSYLLALYMEPYEYFGCNEVPCQCDPNGPPTVAYCPCSAESSCGTFSQFLRSQFTYNPSDCENPRYPTACDHYSYNDTLASPVELWNRKSRFYNTSAAPLVRVTHLQMFDPQAMSRAFTLLATEHPYTLTAEAAASLAANGTLLLPPLGEDESKFANLFSANEFFNAKRYEEHKEWLELYTQEDLDFVNDRLDVDVLALWGFDRVWTGANNTNTTAVPPSFGESHPYPRTPIFGEVGDDDDVGDVADGRSRVHRDRAAAARSLIEPLAGGGPLQEVEGFTLSDVMRWERERPAAWVKPDARQRHSRLLTLLE